MAHLATRQLAPDIPADELLYAGDPRYQAAPLRLDDIGEHLVHLLREQLAGTRPAAEALIRLRAIQAAVPQSARADPPVAAATRILPRRRCPT